ncbi:MAG: phenylacetic acid degradation protein [Nocardioides sp.]|nr:phenylacetic acid degradation protein [Nocardioides sp.]
MDLLGFELLEVDLDAGTMRAAYDGRAEFANLAGHVQGGVLCAMLDSVMGSLVVATLDTGQWAPTLDLQAQFLSPALLGRIEGRSRLVRRGGSVAFVAGELHGPDGRLVATGTATQQIRDRRPGSQS